jgi:hypothetical protein
MAKHAVLINVLIIRKFYPMVNVKSVIPEPSLIKTREHVHLKCVIPGHF